MDKRKFVSTDFPTRGPWFVRITRGEKSRIVIIRNHDFGVSELTMAMIQINWDLE